MERKKAEALISKAKKDYIQGNIRNFMAVRDEVSVEEYRMAMSEDFEVTDDNYIAYDHGILMGMRLALNVLCPEKGIRYSTSGEPIGNKPKPECINCTGEVRCRKEGY